jgi:hypothetical protein
VLPAFHQTTYRTVGPRLDPVVHVTRNSLGFRGPEPPRDFERYLSIVTIGGSTTECRLLSDGKTWPDALARKLAEISPNIWLNNAGSMGTRRTGTRCCSSEGGVAQFSTTNPRKGEKSVVLADPSPLNVSRS